MDDEDAHRAVLKTGAKRVGEIEEVTGWMDQVRLEPKDEGEPPAVSGGDPPKEHRPVALHIRWTRRPQGFVEVGEPIFAFAHEGPPPPAGGGPDLGSVARSQSSRSAITRSRSGSLKISWRSQG